MKVKTNRVIAVIVAAFLIVTALPLATASNANAADKTTDKCSSNSFFPSWYAGKLCDPATGGVVSPASFNKTDTASSLGQWATILALNLVTILLTVVGYVSLGYIIYGGFKFMTSGDSSSGVATARKTITNAVIGLILSIASVAAVTFVAGAIK
ncbi:MAG: rane protein of unknown function [Candidatus Saccharibacteria bacterium]|nr:rane protein of unknown function [Candidatus Saccharibacteria bacterium]